MRLTSKSAPGHGEGWKVPSWLSLIDNKGELSNCFSINQLIRHNIILKKSIETTAKCEFFSIRFWIWKSTPFATTLAYQKAGFVIVHYTRKNAHVVPDLQTSCNKAVVKPISGSVRTACSQLLCHWVWNKLLTSCNKVDDDIRPATSCPNKSNTVCS